VLFELLLLQTLIPSGITFPLPQKLQQSFQEVVKKIFKSIGKLYYGCGSLETMTLLGPIS
jgi:hypothetical protein